MAADTQMMKGILEGCILSIIKREQSYGYRVVEELKTFGFEDVVEATVYPILTRLEKKGDLVFSKKPSKLGPPRKYYALTDKGESTLDEFIRSWERTSVIVGKVLKEEKR